MYTMRNLFLLGFVALTLGSCSTIYYAPNTVSIPTVTQRGDLTLDAGVVGSNQVRGGEVRAAYSPLQNTVLTASYMGMRGSYTEQGAFNPTTGTTQELKYKGSGYMTELGAGYYRQVSPYSTLSIVASGAYGGSKNTLNRKFADLTFARYAIQPGLHVQGQVVDFGCGVRFSNLQFLNGRIDWTLDEFERQKIQRIETDSPLILTDFGVNAGFNLSPVRLRCNFTFSLSENNPDYGFSSNIASLSAMVDLHKLFGKKKK
jgi:hypothetical protein